MSRRSFARVVSPIVASALFIAVVSVAAGPQEKAETKPALKVKKAEPIPPGPPIRDNVGDERTDGGDERQKAIDKIDKLIAAYDLKPHALPPIPDDPPPYEGALIDHPYVVEPPDLVIIEVLEALPGRIISGERLVKPNGTINLGFFGEVYVRGLTLDQVKIAILKHLRKFLDDEILGLVVSPGGEGYNEAAVVDSPKVPKPVIPELPREPVNPFQKLEVPRPSPERPRSAKIDPSLRHGVRSRIPVRPVRARGNRVESQDQEAPAQEQVPLKIEGLGKRRVSITIEIDGQDRPAAVQVQPAPPPVLQHNHVRVQVQPIPPPMVELEGPWRVIPPEESTRVFVDVTAYNSKQYFVLGDVLVPGKLPCTGNETVLDALQYAGGLLPTAELKDIRLIRPGRGGKPTKVYKVDLEAIQEKGDVRSNYQIFPGDRLIFGRNEVVKKTTELDRLNAPLQSITGSMLQIAFALRYVQILSPDRSDEIVKKLIDFWAKELSRTGDVEFDEQKLRELLLHELNKPSGPAQPAPAPEQKKRP